MGPWDPSRDDIALAALAVLLAAGTVALLSRLGLGAGRFLRGSLRSAAQLAVLGLALSCLLPREVWPWQVGGLLVLALLGGAEASSRLARPLPLLPLVALLPVATVAPLLALPAARDLSPRLFLPLAGFLMGNGLGGVVAFVNRFAEQLRERRGEVEARLSLGAPPRQAAEDLFRDAGHAALGPTLQAMALVGLTHAPALFTGGVAAGMHPLRAALFQFLVLQMTGLGTLLAALAGARLSWSRFFTRDLQVREGAGL